ncbi:MerR family DNA-binding transcriptional regulator [Kibdelosporangium aridum]|uniref:MerR family DNA-binding transcriptional regulator n=1 Tax=Kibdelosporangium aridum TaxID=2030 RepID=A0A428YLC2_KIBAR|nr:MerR family transcriptional regulator [Kibdelosporangium aridum]RSM68649.1 MerR family DNA-binding transcriptional regulator [Kibdelosporangium aridum]
MRYSISEVAKCFGIRVSALRYYDELGLLPPAERRGTVRYYGEAELRRLVLIQTLHNQGMVSLADTATLIDDSRQSGRDVLTACVDTISTRISELKAAQQVLEHMLSCPRPEPLRDCPHLRAGLEDGVRAALSRS